MKPMQSKSLIHILLLLAGACQSEPVGPPEHGGRGSSVVVDLGRPFWLRFDETAESDEGGIRVGFRDLLEDSRCPAGVLCVWEGRGRIRLDVRVGAESPVQLELELSAQPPPQSGPRPHEGDVGPYTIRIEDLVPYPTTNSMTKPDEYLAQLRIEKP